MNLKTFNESFRKYYTEDIDDPIKESFETDLRTALIDKAERLGRLGTTSLKRYEIEFQDTIENLVPDKCWWEVTDCSIFDVLFSTHDVYETIDCIIDSLKPEYKNLKESIYSDYGGIMGEPGEQYTDADLKVYWDRNNANDPVLNGYNGNYDAWFKDTISNMDRVNEAIMRRLEAYVSNLNEAEMSDEDKHDSELIRSMIQKMQTRSNAAFTPEEKAVMAKYGITRDTRRKKLTVDGRDLNPNDDTARYGIGWYSNGTPSKINYADRARKLPGRKKNQVAGDGSSTYMQNATYNAHGFGRSGGVQGAERDIRNAKMKEPLDRMRAALTRRGIAQKSIDGAEASREARMAAAQAQYDRAKRNADWWYEQDTVGAARSRDLAQSEIDSLLKKKK